MKELIKRDEYGVFADGNETARVDSLYVAKAFEKEHRAVLRDIRELDCSDKFRLHNFVQSYYKNEQGKKQPCYYMTRDGFAFLVMGYRGKKAALFKELYIQLFNEMETKIKELQAIRQDFPQLTDGIKRLYENPKPFHYSNECNLINKLAFGMTATEFRKLNGIPKGESIRPYLSEKQLYFLNELQKTDIALLRLFPEYKDRKKLLEQCKEQLLTEQSRLTA